MSFKYTFYSTMHEFMRGNRRIAMTVQPHMEITIDTGFMGQYSKSWAFLSAVKRMNFGGKVKPMPFPFRLDTLTVSSMELYGKSSHWTVLEDMYGFRSWNRATQCMIVVSNAIYGGVVNIKETHPPYDIITDRAYDSWQYGEACYLVPMVMGRTFDLEVLPESVKGTFWVNIEDVTTPWPNDPSLLDWRMDSAIPNIAMPNWTYPNYWSLTDAKRPE